jgi:L-iditol 2-dehydrogenase
MNALVLTAPNEFAYKDVPNPEYRVNDVLIRVRACGICGSDVHGMDGSTGRRQPPVIMGHEASGVIEAVGANVIDWCPGDRVTFDSTIYCGTCRFCREGRINLCDNRRVLGVSCDEYRQDGAMAELVVMRQHILYKLPDAVSFAQGATIEAVSIAMHAAARTPVVLNDTALVVGTGVIGLLTIQALRAAGCGTILAVDTNDARLELATLLGADGVFNPDQQNVLDEINVITHGRGVDVAIECVGIESTVDLSIQATRKGGMVTLVGNVSPSVKFPLQSVVTREITLNGSCASRGEYPACLDLIARGVIKVNPLISEIVLLSEGADAFNRLQQRESGLIKVILEP